MSAIKITKFLGTAPKNASELLADTAAQIARSCKLYSGDLIPYPRPVIVDSANRTGVIRTLYALREPDTGDLIWLTWLNDVDIVTPATDTLNEQRFYYTGDGVPKISTYALATSGDPPYPSAYYELGLPLPTVKPTTVATQFTPASTVSFARSAGNNVTLVTEAPHNLKTGALVTVSGFAFRTGTYERTDNALTVTIKKHGLSTGSDILLKFTSGGGTTNTYTITVTDPDTFTCTDPVSGNTSGNVSWDIGDLNTTAEVTVINPTTITYFSAGPIVATTANPTGTYTRAATTITVTLTAHGLTTGDKVALKFLTGDATTGTYEVTVVDANTFTCEDTASGTTSGDVRWNAYDVGTVDLGGQIQARTYLYTWYTGWEEESIGSEPSDALFIKEGQIVTVSTLPTVKPTGNNFIRGIRLYRTLAGTTDAEYFLLRTLWFPNDITRVSRTDNVSTVTFAYPHKLFEDDRFKISGCSDASFNITGGIVTAVVDQYTIEYAQTAANVAEVAATGTLYYDVSENPPTSPARYWGDGFDFSFVDDFDYRSLTSILQSGNYDAPPPDMVGLKLIQNSVLAGFVGNTLYFSEPGLFHAWPKDYSRTFDSNIVGLAQIGGNLLVTTEDYPYILAGSNPAVMSQSRLSARYPCVNSRSIVETSFGVVYATHDGLALYAPATAAQLLTRLIHSSDTWNESLDPSTLVGVAYKDTYIASHATASLVLEPGTGNTGPTFVDNDFAFTATWYDPITNNLYMTAGSDGDIYQWDNLDQPSTLMSWKSKTFITKDFTNVGAARIVADYPAVLGSPKWEDITDTWDGTDLTWNAADPITFRLYVDKELIFTTVSTDNNVFRLPTGYRSDTFELAVDSYVRIRAVYLGDTPLSLRTV